MAGFDGRGPQGMGPMTGWGRGRCNAAGAGFERAYGGFGMGRRRGFGGGRCFGRRAGAFPEYAQPEYPAETGDELETLKARAGSLRETLDRMMRRIDALEKEGE